MAPFAVSAAPLMHAPAVQAPPGQPPSSTHGVPSFAPRSQQLPMLVAKAGGTLHALENSKSRRSSAFDSLSASRSSTHAVASPPPILNACLRQKASSLLPPLATTEASLFMRKTHRSCALKTLPTIAPSALPPWS